MKRKGMWSPRLKASHISAIGSLVGGMRSADAPSNKRITSECRDWYTSRLKIRKPEISAGHQQLFVYLAFHLGGLIPGETMTYQLRFSKIKNRPVRRIALVLALPIMFITNLALHVLGYALHFIFTIHRNQIHLFKGFAHCWSNDTPYVIEDEPRSAAYVVKVELESGINPKS